MRLAHFVRTRVSVRLVLDLRPGGGHLTPEFFLEGQGEARKNRIFLISKVANVRKKVKALAKICSKLVQESKIFSKIVICSNFKAYRK